MSNPHCGLCGKYLPTYFRNMKPLASTNPVEQILLYWQTEDLLRAYQMDVSRLLSQRIFEHEVDGQDVSAWLTDIARCMKSEMVVDQGHTHHSTQMLTLLDELHGRMMGHADYAKEFDQISKVVSGVMERFPRAQGGASAMCELLYSYYLMKLGKGNVSDNLETLCNQAALCLDILSEAYTANDR